jgi:hypothetical protein
MIPQRTQSCQMPEGLLNGHERMQLEQSQPLSAQNCRQVSALMCHVWTPSRLDILCGSAEGRPKMMLLLGHFRAHFSQTRQKSRTPNSIGRSGASGRSVNTFDRRTRGPNLGVINRPLRAISPKPASMAMGMLQAVSLPHGMA